MEDLTLVAVVVVALFFDFTNGFHDTANSIATSVSTRALSPRAAVISAAVLNVAGAFVSLEVAATVAKGIVNPEVITLDVVLAGLVGAITWNLITWYLGLPSSSSHALIGGILGSAVAASGLDVVNWSGLKDKVLIPSLIAPFAGIVIAGALMVAITWLISRRAPGTINRVFRRLQLVSGGFVAFTHGTNDAQKTMGIIALALISSGHLAADADPPTWVIVSAALAMGAGASRRLSAVRWGVAGTIVVAWVITIPCAAAVGALMEIVTRLPLGDAVVFVLAGLIATMAFTARRWQTRRLTTAPA